MSEIKKILSFYLKLNIFLCCLFRYFSSILFINNSKEEEKCTLYEFYERVINKYERRDVFFGKNVHKSLKKHFLGNFNKIFKRFLGCLICNYEGN